MRSVIRLAVFIGLLVAVASTASAQLNATKFPVSGVVFEPTMGVFAAGAGDTVRWRVVLESTAPLPITLDFNDQVGGDSCQMFGGGAPAPCNSDGTLQLLCPPMGADAPDYGGFDPTGTCDEVNNRFGIGSVTIPPAGVVCFEFSTMIDPAALGFVANAGCLNVTAPFPQVAPTVPPDTTVGSWPWTCGPPNPPTPVSPVINPCTQVVITELPDFEFDILKEAVLDDLNGNGVPDVGEVVTWTVTMSDTSTDMEDATGYFLDDLQAGQTFGAIDPTANPGNCVHDPGLNRITCDELTFADGEVKTLSFTTQIDCTALSDTDDVQICNQAALCQDIGLTQCFPSDDDGMFSGTPDPTCLDFEQVGLAASTKTWSWVDEDGDGALSTGDTVTFTITVANDGRKDAVNVFVDDDVSALLDGVGGCLQEASIVVNDGGAYAAGIVSWTIPGPIATGEMASVSFDVTVDEVEPCCDQATVNTEERVSGCPGDPGVLTDDPGTSATDDPTCLVFGPQPNLTVTKDFTLTNDADGDGEVSTGDEITFDVVITNDGGGAATGVSLNDPVLACFGNCSAVTITGEGTDNSIGPGMSTSCTIIVDDIGGGDGLLPMESVTVSWSVTVNVLACCNQATVTYVESPMAVSSIDPSIGSGATCADRSGAELEITKTATDADGDGCYEPGETVTFELTVRSVGGADATNVLLRDAVGPDMTVTDRDGGVEVDPATTEWDLMTMAPGAVEVRTLTVMLACGDGMSPITDGQPLSNLASVSSDTAGTVRTQWTDAFGVPVLEVTKDAADADGDDVLAIGEVATYTITVANSGSCSADNVVVTDLVDPDLDRAMITSMPAGQDDGMGNLTWDETDEPALASIAPGGMVVLTVTAPALDPATNPDPGADSQADNTAVATANSPDAMLCPGLPPLTASGDAPALPVGMAPGPRLQVTKTAMDADGDGCYEPGEDVVYTIEVENVGTEAATGVRLVDDRLGSGVLTVVDNGGGMEAGETISWNLGMLGVGAIETRTWTGNVDPAAADGTPFMDTATASANNGGDDSADWMGEVSFSVLEVSKSSVYEDTNGSGTRNAGDTVTYTITVTNNGTCTVDGVSVTDVVDGDLDWGSLTINNGGTDDGGMPPTITWDETGEPALAAIAPSASVMVSFSATVNDETANPQGGDGSIANDTEVAATPGPSGTSMPVPDPVVYVIGDPIGDAVVLRNGLVSCRLEAVSVYPDVFTGAEPQIDVGNADTTSTPAPASPLTFAGDAAVVGADTCPQPMTGGTSILVFYEYSMPVDSLRVAKAGDDIEVSW